METLSTKLKGTDINLDFDAVKNNLKVFLSSQLQFRDYDFESSGMSVLLNVLAYNTQSNAMTAHLALNEIFLDSAQARTTIVALAKQLGYTPNSVSSSIATINLTVIPSVSFNQTSATLKEGVLFSGGGLNWYVTESQTVARDDTGRFIFPNVNIRQGVRKVTRYYFDSKNPYAKFEIPDRDVDTSTLKVRVKESESTTIFHTYIPFTVFSEIDDNSPIYFLEENALGMYEIYFTGGNVGISPHGGNIIELDYFYSVGAAANGVSVFTSDNSITNASEKKYIELVARSSGGSDKEGIESIRFNAPHFFEAQNRCVSYKDYAAIIKKNFTQAESINVWGGEDSTPAEYGRVYICVKPYNGDTISDASKKYIIEEILSPRKVATISPRIVDPEYTFIGLDIVSKYDETKTTNSSQQIAQIIRDAVETYNSENLSSFDGVFRHSNMLHAIDNAEMSIKSTVIRTTLIKKITLSNTNDNEFQLLIPSDIYDYDVNNSFIKSTMIMINNRAHYITDRAYLNDGQKRQLILVYFGETGGQVIENVDIGYLDITNRTLYLYGFRPDVTTDVKIFINPKSNDIIPTQNQLLKIDIGETKIAVEKDFIRSLNSLGPDRTNATPKNTAFFE